MEAEWAINLEMPTCPGRLLQRLVRCFLFPRLLRLLRFPIGVRIRPVAPTLHPTRHPALIVVLELLAIRQQPRKRHDDCVDDADDKRHCQQLKQRPIECANDASVRQICWRPEKHQ